MYEIYFCHGPNLGHSDGNKYIYKSSTLQHEDANLEEIEKVSQNHLGY